MQSPRYVAKYGAIRFLSCPGRAGIVSKFRAVSGTACKMPSPTPPKSAKVELRLLRQLPIYPMFGRGLTRLQPAYVEDVAEAIARALQGAETHAVTYECGGPRVYSYEEF